jgi:hypothetical protein
MLQPSGLTKKCPVPGSGLGVVQLRQWFAEVDDDFASRSVDDNLKGIRDRSECSFSRQEERRAGS